MSELTNRPWHKNWPADVPKTIKYDSRLPITRIRERAAKFPNRVALLSEDKTMSYGELVEKIDYFAAVLSRMGASRDDRIAVMLKNCIEFAVVFYAILDLGAIAILIDPTDSSTFLERKLKETEPEIVITHDTLFLEHKDSLFLKKNILVRDTHYSWRWIDKLRVVTSIAWFTVTEAVNTVTYFDELIAQKFTLMEDKDTVHPDDVACIIYSSALKGVQLTHRDLSIGAQQTAAWAKLWFADRFISIFPIFKSFGLSFCLNLPLSIGGSVILMPSNDMKRVLETIQKYRPTILIGTSGIYESLAYFKGLKKYDLSSLQFSYTIDRVAPEVRSKIKEQVEWELIEGYGLSESTTVQCCNIPKKTKQDSVGLPLPNVDIKIVSLYNRDIELPPNEVGEILIKSPSIMKGYWRLQKESLGALQNGWLLTGDVGKVDEKGFFYIYNKKQDLIRTKAGLIYPKEIEEILNSHPSVVESAVVGVPKNGVDYIVGLVTLDKKESVLPQELIGFCTLALDKHKIPDYVIVVDELPRNEAGRLLRQDIRAKVGKDIKID